MLARQLQPRARAKALTHLPRYVSTHNSFVTWNQSQKVRIIIILDFSLSEHHQVSLLVKARFQGLYFRDLCLSNCSYAPQGTYRFAVEHRFRCVTFYKYHDVLPNMTPFEHIGKRKSLIGFVS